MGYDFTDMRIVGFGFIVNISLILIQVIYLLISSRETSLASGHTYDCSSASGVTLKNMDKIYRSQTITNAIKREPCEHTFLWIYHTRTEIVKSHTTGQYVRTAPGLLQGELLSYILRPPPHSLKIHDPCSIPALYTALCKAVHP